MVRRAFKRIASFVRHLRHMPPPPDPKGGYNPDTTQIKDAARAAFSLKGAGSGGGATAGTSQTDKMIGKAIADTHKADHHR